MTRSSDPAGRSKVKPQASAQTRIGRSRTGLGLFATDTFKRGDFIAEYTGERIPNSEADRRASKYLFETSDRWSIDGAGRSNIARYINHSCAPNAVAEIDRGRVYIYAKKRIEPGQEITYNYGRNYFSTVIAPIGCRCVACAGEEPRKARAVENGAKRANGHANGKGSARSNGHANGHAKGRANGAAGD